MNTLTFEVDPRKLEQAILSNGLSSKRLSEKSGVSKQSLGRMRRHGVQTRPETIYKVAHALGVEPKELLRTEGEENGK